MGLLLDRIKQIELTPQSEVIEEIDENDEFSTTLNKKEKKFQKNFPDLEAMPPEISLQILKNLNATDLCLAACVWSSLANDDVLWQSLCKSTWGHASIYNENIKKKKEFQVYIHAFR